MRWIWVALLLLGCGGPSQQTTRDGPTAGAASSGDDASVEAERAPEGASAETEPASGAPSREGGAAQLLSQGWSCPDGFEVVAEQEVAPERREGRRFLPRGWVCRQDDRVQPLVPSHDATCRMRHVVQPVPERPRRGGCGSCNMDAEERWERERDMPRAEYWVCELCYADSECPGDQACVARPVSQLPQGTPPRALADRYRVMGPGLPAMRARVCGPRPPPPMSEDERNQLPGMAPR